jgi:hypothetical protein
MYLFISKIMKEVLENLDEAVRKLIEDKSRNHDEDADLHNNDEDTELPKYVVDLYENGGENISDENMPLIQKSIQEVVEIGSYFKEKKRKSRLMKMEDEVG